MNFEQTILEQIKTINPAAKAAFFSGTLFVTTDNAVCTGDVYRILDVIQAANPVLKMQSSRVGDDIAVDFIA